MSSEAPAYDSRYLAGIVLFNEGEFFEAHEVWEGLWMETTGDEKRFIQALIQAAVALCHFCNGNVRGAVKLFRSSRAYMEKYGSPHWGLDQTVFWSQMEACFAPILGAETPPNGITPEEELIPTIALDPAPDQWPDPDEFLDDD
ncbi:MAG: DUF309 domain-containing protein [Gemmataceae bacterium]